MNILHSNKENESIFPASMLIAADRRRKNLGEFYKPSVPKRFDEQGHKQREGFVVCGKRCDTCRPSDNRKTIKSKWDGRTWHIRENITCDIPNVIYMMECKEHDDFLYVGSTTNLKKRWANHKSDAKNKKTTKCKVAYHVGSLKHSDDSNMSFLKITPIEIVRNERKLLERELFWQANLGTLQTGFNERKDFSRILKHRIHYQI